jgi:maleate isomerase
MATKLDEPRISEQHLPHSLDGGIAERAGIGLIVLATDQTLEHECRRLLDLPGVAFYESRILNDAAITPATLKAMEARLAEATGLILPGLPLDVVGFGCTSASMVIGEERVFELIRSVRPGIACTTPITAAFAAFRALGVRRLALLTPYRDDINRFMRGYIEARGFEVPVMGSFNEEDDRRAARIDAASIRDAALRLGRAAGIDGVFVSCTSLRLVDAVASIEAELGRPATSSNHALAWHCLRLAGIDDRRPEFGRLFEETLA